VVVTQVTAHAADTVVALGEAKWQAETVDVDQLSRLEHLRELLNVGPRTKLLLFSRRGFSRRLTAAASTRDDVELVDLLRLYNGG
jgi:hypothetical protein